MDIDNSNDLDIFENFDNNPIIVNLKNNKSVSNAELLKYQCYELFYVIFKLAITGNKNAIQIIKKNQHYGGLLFDYIWTRFLFDNGDYTVCNELATKYYYDNIKIQNEILRIGLKHGDQTCISKFVCIHLSNNQYDEALDLFTKLTNPSVDLLCSIGQLYENRNDYENALKLYLQISKKYSHYFKKIDVFYGKFYDKMKGSSNLTEKLEWFRLLQKELPDSHNEIEIYCEKLQNEIIEQQKDQRIADLEKLISKLTTNQYDGNSKKRRLTNQLSDPI